MKFSTPAAPMGATRFSAGSFALSGRWLKSRWLAAVLSVGVSAAHAQAGWQSVDIGTSTAGTTSESDGVVAITASGADIWEQADEFRYRYQAWTGDGVMTARVAYLDNTDGWAKAAVMFRETLAANSRHAMTTASALHGTAFQYRSTTGAETVTTPPSETQGTDRWLRISRTGDTLTGFVSGDGVVWTQTGTVTLPGLPTSIYVGLAVTSHNDGVLCTARFDNVTLGSDLAPPPSTQPPHVVSFTIESSRQDSLYEAHAIYRLIFTKSVTGVDTTDFSSFSLAGSPSIDSGPTVESVSGSGASYAIVAHQFYNSSSGGQFRINLIPGGIVDADGNPLNEGAIGPVHKTAGGPWPIGGVILPAAGTYTAGQTLSFKVDYGVTGMVVTGAPRIALTIGAATRYATYVGPLGGGQFLAQTLVFEYVVQASDSDTDGITMSSAIDLNGGTIRGANGADGLLTFTPPDTRGITVNGMPLPANGWTSRDIGTTTLGSTSVASDGRSVVVSGSGRDIWSEADAFRYYSTQETTPDCDLVARVTGLTNTDGWAKAGLMFRASLDPASRFYLVAVTPEHGIVFQSRGSTGALAQQTTAAIAGAAPCWLKISRRGVSYSGYVSSDGVNWTQVGNGSSSNNSSTEPMYVGLAVTSHNDGVLCPATFENVALTPGGDSAPVISSITPPDGSSAGTNAYSFGSQLIIHVNFSTTVTVSGVPRIGLSIGGAPRQASYFFGSGTSSLHFAYIVDSGDNGSLAINGPIDLNGGTIQASDGANANLAFTAPNTQAVVVNGTTPSLAPKVTGITSGTVSADGTTAIISTTASVVQFPELRGIGQPGTKVFVADSTDPDSLPNGEGWVNSNGEWKLTCASPLLQLGDSYRQVIWARDDGRHISTVGSITISVQPAAGGPAWSSRDIGTSTAGSTSVSGGGMVTLAGSGRDIWNEADGFRYYSMPAAAQDCDLVARVTGLTNTDGWAKAGLMFRSSLDPTSRFYLVAVTPEHGIVFQSRGSTGALAQQTTAATAGAAPCWLKISRRGVSYSGYVSNDGVNWTQVGNGSSSANSSTELMLVGLAVTSHNDGTLCTATFANVTLTPVTASGTAPAAPTNARVARLGPNGAVDFAWSDNATNETGFVIEALQEISGNPDNTWVERATAGANATQATVTLGQGTQYRLRVKAINGTASSGYVASDSFTTTATPTVRVAGASATSVLLEIEARLNQSGAPRINGPFAVERSTDGVTFTQIASGIGDGSISPVAPGGLSYSDTTVSAGVQYHYRARYLDSSGNTSGYSTLVSATAGSASAPAAPSGLAATAVSGTEIRLTWSDNSNNETGFEIHRWVDITSGSVIAAPGANTTSYANSGLTPGTYYEYRVRAVNAAGASAFSNVVSVTTPANPTATWNSRDIGTSTVGGTGGSGSTVMLNGSGRDIWDNADGFRYYYMQAAASDCDLVTRVTGLTNTNGWAKAGLMFRTSLDANSSFYMIAVTPEHGVVFQSRGSAGESAQGGTVAAGGVPRWLKISRRGISYFGYVSTDGVNWTQVGGGSNSSNSSAAPMYVGLAVTSHNDGVLCGATFENVSFNSTGGVTPPPADPGLPAAPSNLVVTAPAPHRLQLTWADNATDETGYEIQRSTDGVKFTTFFLGGGPGLTSYSDENLPGSTTYFYRVRAVNVLVGASEFSNVAAQTTLPESASWNSNDVGIVAARGSANLTSLASGTINGSGADIWGRADAFHYLWRPLKGDGSIVVRITGMANTSSWAKAGVMIREGPDRGARNVFVCLTPEGHGIFAQARPVAGDLTSSTAGPVVNTPYWLRLSRSGNIFTAAASPDGASWTPLATYAISMDPATYIGLAVTSHNDGTICAATFDNAIITEGSSTPSGTTPPAPTNLVATASAWNRIDLAWKDNASDELGYEIQWASNPTDFSTLSNVGANVTTAAVTGLFQETLCYFRVRALNASGASAFSNVATATTPPYPAPATLGAPTNLRATATSDTTIALAWTDNASSEWGFEMGISTDGVRYDWGGKTLANVTTNTWSALRPGTLYYFQVRAYQDIGTLFYVHSAPSNTVTATTSGSPPPTSLPNAPSDLVATVASSTQINLAWADHSSEETGFEIARSTDNVSFTRIATANANQTPNLVTYSDTGLAAGTTYYYYVRAVNAAGFSAATNTATATTTTTAPAPNWAFRDIGAVGIAGTNNSSGNTITVSGSGADIWERADAFRFVYRAWTGDGVVEARVTSMDSANEWARAGVMIRESLEANAKNVFLCVTPSYHGAIAQARSNTGDLTGQTQGPFANAPYWVRLVRSGNDFRRYFSADGVNWIDHGYYIIPMNTTVYFGFAVTSHDNGRLNTAVFSDPFVGAR